MGNHQRRVLITETPDYHKVPETLDEALNKIEALKQEIEILNSLIRTVRRCETVSVRRFIWYLHQRGKTIAQISALTNWTPHKVDSHLRKMIRK